MATTTKNTKQSTNGLVMQKVQAMPTGGRGRTSMYAKALEELKANPAQPFLVRSCKNPSAAASARTQLVKLAKSEGVTLDARVSGSDLYAVATKRRAK